jgi:hypothetical protein
MFDIIFDLFSLHSIVLSVLVRMRSFSVFIIRCAIAATTMLPQSVFFIPFQPIPQQAKKLATAIAVARYFENTLVHAEIIRFPLSVREIEYSQKHLIALDCMQVIHQAILPLSQQSSRSQHRH